MSFNKKFALTLKNKFLLPVLSILSKSRVRTHEQDVNANPYAEILRESKSHQAETNQNEMPSMTCLKSLLHLLHEIMWRMN